VQEIYLAAEAMGTSTGHDRAHARYRNDRDAHAGPRRIRRQRFGIKPGAASC
jgi:hypothetical protein